MCGIAGVVSRSTQVSRDEVSSMLEALRHRGPDDFGVYNSACGSIGFGHVRLSVLDLSPAGHQPMVDLDVGSVLVFNGEIYNYRELRAGLDKSFNINWAGHSDSEVLFQLLMRYPVPSVLAKIRGMFSFAFYDASLDKIFLCRDRMGEKPLYYGCVSGKYVFSSELKGLKGNLSLNLKVDQSALTGYFSHNFIPSPMSIYEGVNKLPPGSYTELRLKDGEWCEPIRYWEPFSSSRLSVDACSYESIVDGLERHLISATDEQLVSDVPIGCFLSGGYDSTLVMALAQRASRRPVKTFSIGFNVDKYNEAHYAKEVARELGTEHHELYLSDVDVMNSVPDISDIWDEPFADSSQLPTLLLSRFAKESVTVALSGDGGDELFAGYPRYIAYKNLVNKLRVFPSPVRKLSSNVIAKSEEFLSRISHQELSKKMQSLMRFKGVVSASNEAEAYLALISNSYGSPVKERRSGDYWFSTQAAENVDSLSRVMDMDQRCYLPDDILVKVDRAAMSCSLETRVPFLDHRVVEYSWKVPIEYLYKNHKGGKSPIKDLVHKYVPRSIMDRPKKGFSIPLDDWLKGGLKDWAGELIYQTRVNPCGMLDENVVEKLWSDFLSGRRSCGSQIWAILMYRSWLNRK